ncbi:putative type VI secretion system effector [Acinetobacter indicus]|uniref:putative type VI secretion system effector n=1 Tax=Acinetobacter indicus TaxID=756892 RepID=UPI001315848C|nr:putative type VI secretion system effector [Acinetobacter indicus]
MIKIEGKIQNLKVEDSKIVSIGNLGKHAANTALIGALTGSASLMSNAPLMALAAKGRDGKTIRGEINGIRIVGQFTGVKFENNTPLVMVISEEQEEGYHYVYAVLDPKKGLLYMPYEMGRSTKKYYYNFFKFSVIWSVVFCFIFTIIAAIQYYSVADSNLESFKTDLMYFYPISILFSLCLHLFWGKIILDI